ncbi:MAG: alpha-glucosidase/alpha-galactosidase [Oscillospiraceae bacterium]|jgi:alpha-galactosidase|nr:alpha-glucosidase/alpha-galactosidase [Oscillospiraceae bacterium]
MEIKIAYIGGGSRHWARSFMSDLALDDELSGEIRLYDIDMDAAKCNEIIGNRMTKDPQSVGKWKYRAVENLSEALIEADFVIISILPGTLENMSIDVHLPERLGIYQSVGDTVGPGGIIRALRTIPPYIEFAEAIKAYAPSAWVINYTNPMSLCIRTLYHIVPEIKAFGCCHEVFGTQQLLTAMINEETGVQPNRDEIYTNVIGLNHFTWFDKATYQDINLIDLFSRFVEKYPIEGYKSDNFDENMKYFSGRNLVKFDLFKKYGIIAAAGDRHLAEFMPGDIYLKNPETVTEKYKFFITPVSWRINDRNEKIEQTKRLVAGEEDIKFINSGEEGVLLIKALCGLTRVISNVNLPNSMLQIHNLPPETVVETNAIFSKDDVRPVSAGVLPDDILTLIKPHVENQTTVLNAALTYDYSLLYEAFERDPLVAGRSSMTNIRFLVDDMIKETIGNITK